MNEVIKLQQDTAYYLTLSASEKEVFLQKQYEAIRQMTPAERREQVETIEQRVKRIALLLTEAPQSV